MVIRVDPTERRIGLSLKELAAAIEPEEAKDHRGRQRKRSRGAYDEEEEE